MRLGFRSAVRRARGSLDRPAEPPDARSQMLFYESNPGLRNNLIQTRVLKVRPPDQESIVTSSEVGTAERVRTAYRLAAAEARGRPELAPSGQWDRLIATSYGELIRALEGDDLQVLARTLEGMFAGAATAGLSMGGEVGYLSDLSGRQFYLDWWIDGMYSLASYLGVLGEVQDTGQVPIDSVAAFDALYSRMADRLGTGVDFPRVCGAWGIESRGALTPRTSWRHIHAALAMLDETRLLTTARIVEVGGGFGGVAYWTQRLRPEAVVYTIYDFPIVNAIAGYFLLRALPAALVVLNGEPPKVGAPQIALLPHWRVFQEPDRSADIAFNQDSLPEMPREAAIQYLEAFDRITRVGFYSENQEDGHRWDPDDPATAQLRLPDLETHLRRLHRSSRYRAWMRRGYVETLYRPGPEVPD